MWCCSIIVTSRTWTEIIHMWVLIDAYIFTKIFPRTHILLYEAEVETLMALQREKACNHAGMQSADALGSDPLGGTTTSVPDAGPGTVEEDDGPADDFFPEYGQDLNSQDFGDEEKNQQDHEQQKKDEYWPFEDSVRPQDTADDGESDEDSETLAQRQRCGNGQEQEANRRH